MQYEKLGQADFDAIVTGELTHYAIWLEDELNEIITSYFVSDSAIQADFRRLILYRDGLTAQDKIEIVRAMLPIFELADNDLKTWRGLLTEIGDFKSWRNAMAHGFDYTKTPYAGKLEIEIVSRSGKPKRIEITPASHREAIEGVSELLERVEKAKAEILGIGST